MSDEEVEAIRDFFLQNQVTAPSYDESVKNILIFQNVILYMKKDGIYRKRLLMQMTYHSDIRSLLSIY